MVVLIVAGGWMMVATGGFSLRGAMALSLFIAVASPMQASQGLSLREIRMLPLSRRDLWRATWLVGIIGSALAIVAGVEIAAVISAAYTSVRVPPESIAVAAILVVVMGGISASSVLLLNVLSLAPVRALPARARAVVKGLVTLVPVALLALPVVGKNVLPSTWAQFGITGAILTILGLAVVGYSYFQTPNRLPAASPRRAMAATRPSQGSAFTPSAIGGLPRLFLETWKRALLIQLAIPIITIATTVIVSGVTGWGDSDWRANLRDFGFLPFEGAGNKNMAMLYFMAAPVFMWNWLAPGDALFTMARHLRTLPMSVRQLNWLLLGLPVVPWINLWFLLLGLHALVSDQPISSYRWPAFLALVGADALARAVRLRLSDSAGQRLWFFTAFLVGLIAGSKTVAIPLTIGWVALLVAGPLNLHTLSTKRAAYQRQTKSLPYDHRG